MTDEHVHWKKLVKEFNVTRERIRQIEAKALRKLRHPSRSRKLRDYLGLMEGVLEDGRVWIPDWRKSSARCFYPAETGYFGSIWNGC